MGTSKPDLIMCPQCTELREPDCFIRQRYVNGKCVNESYKTCVDCRMRGIRKARGELTTWKPSTIEADKPQYWSVGNDKITQAVIERIKSKL